MKNIFLKKITPHILIIIIILIFSFLITEPFLEDIKNKKEDNDILKISSIGQGPTSLLKLLSEVFDSEQFNSLVEPRIKLPVVQADVASDNFDKIRRDGQLGLIGRNNPFLQVE